MSTDLSAHVSMVAQYRRVTFQNAWNLGIIAQASPQVPRKCPCRLPAFDGK